MNDLQLARCTIVALSLMLASLLTALTVLWRRYKTLTADCWDLIHTCNAIKARMDEAIVKEKMRELDSGLKAKRPRPDGDEWKDG